MNNSKKQFISLLTGQILYLVFTFVLPLFLVRVLSMADYGLYAQFNMLTSLFIPVFTLAFSSELYYYFPRKDHSENKSSLVIQSLLLLFCASCISIFLLNIPSIRSYIDTNQDFTNVYGYLVAYIAFSIPEFITTNLYVVNNNHLLSAIFLPISTIIRVVAIIVGYILYPSINTIFIVLVGTAILRLMFTIFYVFWVAISIGEISFSLSLIKRQIKYCLPLGLAQSLKTVGSQIDKFILLAFITPAQYAVYSIAFYGIPGLMQIYLAISQTYIPKMVCAYKEQGTHALINEYRSMISKTLSYTIPIIAVFVVSADIIIPIVFSDKYIESIPYFQIYLISFIFSSLGCGNILRAIGRTTYTMYVYLVVIGLMIPITYLGINRYGMDGAIICSTCSMVLPLLVLLFFDSHAIHVSVFNLFPWRNIGFICISSIVGVIVAVLLRSVFDYKNFGFLLFLLSASLGVVVCLELIFDVFFISYQSFKGKLLQYYQCLFVNRND